MTSFISPFRSSLFTLSLLLLLLATPVPGPAAAAQARLKALFLGDDGHHRPADRFQQLQPVLSARGIDLTYTDKLGDLNPATLAAYDALAIYANHTAISPEQEQALLDYVAAGKGVVPIHCASYCFLNSPKYIELVGGQFKSHGTGVFKETLVNATHPVMQGLTPIESWDETYVHTKHNPNRLVLAERRDDQGAEPYTWVREHGRGRVFYTAWGHDQRTWSNPGFHALLENGIRWAAGGASLDLRPKSGLKPFEYVDAPDRLPNYVPGAQWGTQADPITKMQKPLDPDESQKHLVLRDGFEARLFASEPAVTKPVAMAWDARGRLWIAETVDYPNELKPKGEGRDRIKVCEDTDADGRADKFSVFADQLSIPTSLVFANGGVIVTSAGDTILFKDTDGDDKADQRTVLFSGWGQNDTHATVSNLRYGFDNWIWGTVGYSGFDGTVGGKRIKFGMGVFRFKPDGSALEFIKSSNNNTWGLGLSEEGIVFGSTANNNASWYMPVANRYYEAVRGWSASRMETIADSQAFYPVTEKVRQVDAHGRYTAGAGHALYTARSFPKGYWNRVAFVAEPTGHLIGHFAMIARGADFVAHNERSFLASDDEWTAPIMAEVGPDGALWVIDWYNYIVQHNPTPRGFRTGKGNAYETTLRDKRHGRIYRVVHAESKPGAQPRLASASGADLVAALKSDNQLWRMHAQRLLVERGQKDVVPALLELVNDQRTDEIGLNTAAIHALWTLHGLGGFDDSSAVAAAEAALKHPSAGVRRAAVSVMPQTTKTILAIIYRELLRDPDAQVRLAAFLALADAPAFEPVGAGIYSALKDDRNKKDKWIRHAATSAAARNDTGFLKAALADGAGQPAARTAAKESAAPRANVLPNPSFENERDGRPLDWTRRTYGGQATHTYAEIGRTGSRSVKISSETGSDTSWFARAALKPNTDYRLSAWIKTENVKGAMGALLNVHELQGPRTPAVTGTKDWTRVEMAFNSGDAREATINCLFGGWGRSTGAAWFDDLELIPGSSAPATEVGEVLRIVTGHYAQRGPVESIVPTLAALQGAPADKANPILDGLASGWPQGTAPMLNEADKATLAAVMKSLPDASRDRLLALAQRWGRADLFGDAVAAITRKLLEQITDASAPDERRVEAAQSLVRLEDQPATFAGVLQPITLQSTPNLSRGLIGAVGESRHAQAGRELTARWKNYTPASRRVAVTTLMRRPDWVAALLDAIEQGKIQRTDLAPEHWQQLKLNADEQLATRANQLASAGPAISADREELVKKLLPVAQRKGDAVRGKEVFKTSCANCHTIEGEGAKIGPELTGISARPRLDILLEILDPNRSVEANYRMWNVTTTDGETISGRLDTETQTSLEILDLTSKKHVIQRKDIASLDPSTLSIMPTGFESLPETDLAALLEYLASGSHDAAAK